MKKNLLLGLCVLLLLSVVSAQPFAEWEPVINFSEFSDEYFEGTVFYGRFEFADDKMFMYGFFNVNESYSNELWYYDLISEEWFFIVEDERHVKPVIDFVSPLFYDDKLFFFRGTGFHQWSMGTGLTFHDVYLEYYDLVEGDFFNETYFPIYDFFVPEDEYYAKIDRFGQLFHDDKFYLFGGRIVSKHNVTGNDIISSSNRSFVYDFSDGYWTELANMPVDFSEISTIRKGNKIFVKGGVEDPGSVLINELLIYDIDEDEWEIGAQSPHITISPKNVARGVNSFYYVGGVSDYYYWNYSDSFVRYNVLSNTWDVLPNLPSYMFDGGDKWVYYVGGIGNKLYAVVEHNGADMVYMLNVPAETPPRRGGGGWPAEVTTVEEVEDGVVVTGSGAPLFAIGVGGEDGVGAVWVIGVVLLLLIALLYLFLEERLNKKSRRKRR